MKYMKYIKYIILFALFLFACVRMVLFYGLVSGIEHSFIAFISGCFLAIPVIMYKNYINNNINSKIDK